MKRSHAVLLIAGIGLPPHLALAQDTETQVADPPARAEEQSEPPAPEPSEPSSESDGSESDGTNSEVPGSSSSVEPSPATSPESVAPEGPSAADNAAEIAELRAELNAMRAEREEAEMAALSAEAESTIHEDVLKIYGFMDMGVQRHWTKQSSLVSSIFDTNATTFVLGNVDFYFDMNPHQDWRGLAEVRFTNAPHGEIASYGGLGGGFERTDTRQYDPHGTVLNAPMWGGYTVIERAWIEWKRHSLLRVRVGNFFTPWGIWNVDHGSPTLISMAMPQFIQQRFIPLRQTGVQALGTHFFGDVEWGYHAWLTNGRGTFSTNDFDDKKAIGARSYIRTAGNSVNTQLGTSFHHGRVADKVVDLDNVAPLEFSTHETVAYTENAIGVDLSLDVGKTRIRAEGTAQLRQWEEDKGNPIGFTSPVKDAYESDHWRYGAYALVAHRTPWLGIEPYIYAEVVHQMWELPDLFALGSVGANVHFTPSVILKIQGTRAAFFNWKKETLEDPSTNDTSSLIGRLVMAF